MKRAKELYTVMDKISLSSTESPFVPRGLDCASFIALKTRWVVPNLKYKVMEVVHPELRE